MSTRLRRLAAIRLLSHVHLFSGRIFVRTGRLQVTTCFAHTTRRIGSAGTENLEYWDAPRSVDTFAMRPAGLRVT